MPLPLSRRRDAVYYFRAAAAATLRWFDGEHASAMRADIRHIRASALIFFADLHAMFMFSCRSICYAAA